MFFAGHPHGPAAGLRGAYLFSTALTVAGRWVGAVLLRTRRDR